MSRRTSRRRGAPAARVSCSSLSSPLACLGGAPGVYLDADCSTALTVSSAGSLILNSRFGTAFASPRSSALEVWVIQGWCGHQSLSVLRVGIDRSVGAAHEGSQNFSVARTGQRWMPPKISSANGRNGCPDVRPFRIAILLNVIITTRSVAMSTARSSIGNDAANGFTRIFTRQRVSAGRPEHPRCEGSPSDAGTDRHEAFGGPRSHIRVRAEAETGALEGLRRRMSRCPRRRRPRVRRPGRRRARREGGRSRRPGEPRRR